MYVQTYLDSNRAKKAGGYILVIYLHNNDTVLHFVSRNPRYSPGFKKIEKINATAPQRNAIKYFAIFKNVAHSLEPGETSSYSASHQAPNYVCNVLKFSEK